MVELAWKTANDQCTSLALALALALGTGCKHVCETFACHDSRLHTDNVPWQVTMNLLPSDTVYVVFGFELVDSSHSEQGTPMHHTIVDTSAAPTPAPGTHGRTPDLGVVYELVGLDSRSEEPTLAQVHDITRWGTPVGIIRRPVGKLAQLDANLQRDAHSLERATRKGLPDTIVYQSPNDINVLDKLPEVVKWSGMPLLRKIVYHCIRAYLLTQPNCTVQEGPSIGDSKCQQMESGLIDWMLFGSRNLTHVTSSWVNIARAKQRSINQIAHNHLSPYKSALTGIYYVTSGWSDVQHMEPRTTNLKLLNPAVSASRGHMEANIITIKPVPGLMIVFPTYVKHVRASALVQHTSCVLCNFHSQIGYAHEVGNLGGIFVCPLYT